MISELYFVGVWDRGAVRQFGGTADIDRLFTMYPGGLLHGSDISFEVVRDDGGS